MLRDLEGDGLLIHHWDTDGICSAALLLKYLEPKRLTNWTPDIGSFYLTDEQIECAKGFDYIIVADMALPENDIRRLSEAADVHILDHHKQKPIEGVHHVNPVAHGAPADDYPSCTWLVKEKLGLPVSLHVVLGFIGDKEQKIKDNRKFWGITEAYMAENSTSFEELLELVGLIDSIYKVGDKAGVEEAPRLLNGYASPEDIKGNSQWRGNLKLFDGKLDEILAEPPEEVEGVLMKRLDTKYAVISAVTRRIAWGTGRDTIVVNTGFFPEHDQLYSRSKNRDMGPMIARARMLGFNAGGKKDVVGAIIPKGETESFIKELLDFFKEK
ncbi:DHH family phosphoesterase [Candidatus Bathyarchaeota archaeon]|nr:DHH family phosphoesterase [Candidatus Bathyarchaeota archaeon]